MTHSPPRPRARPTDERPPASWPLRIAIAATFAATVLGSGQSHAIEAYAGIGLPGPVFGIAHPVAPSFGLRADIGGFDRIETTRTREGTDYDVKAKLTRLGFFGDWFVLGGSFRLTGGLTFNDMRADLALAGAGTTVSFGDNTYTLGPDDRFDGRVEMPALTPYLGIGWGYRPDRVGWGFAADLGASIGKPKVSGRVSGPIATSQPQIQQDVEAELQQVRGDLPSFFPQITIGVSYRF